MVDRGLYEAPSDGLSDEGPVRYFQLPMETRIQESDRIPISKSQHEFTRLKFSKAVFHRYW